MYEEDVTAHVVFTHDVVAATEDDEPHVLRQHLDKRLVGVVKQRHLANETNSDIWWTKQTVTSGGQNKQRHLADEKKIGKSGGFRRFHRKR